MSDTSLQPAPDRATRAAPGGVALRVLGGAATLTAVLIAPSAATSPLGRSLGGAVGGELVGASIAQCDEPSCRPESPRLDRASYARALSLDLRGTIAIAATESGQGFGMGDVHAAHARQQELAPH